MRATLELTPHRAWTSHHVYRQPDGAFQRFGWGHFDGGASGRAQAGEEQAELATSADPLGRIESK